MDEPEPFPLMRLPKELRLMVYERLPREIKHIVCRGLDGGVTIVLIRPYTYTAILATSKQVYEEAHDIVDQIMHNFIRAKRPRIALSYEGCSSAQSNFRFFKKMFLNYVNMTGPPDGKTLTRLEFLRRDTILPVRAKHAEFHESVMSWWHQVYVQETWWHHLRVQETWQQSGGQPSSLTKIGLDRFVIDSVFPLSSTSESHRLALEPRQMANTARYLYLLSRSTGRYWYINTLGAFEVEHRPGGKVLFVADKSRRHSPEYNYTKYTSSSPALFHFWNESGTKTVI